MRTIALACVDDVSIPRQGGSHLRKALGLRPAEELPALLAISEAMVLMGIKANETWALPERVEALVEAWRRWISRRSLAVSSLFSHLLKTVLRFDDYDSEWVLLASLDAAVPIEPGPREAHTLAAPGPAEHVDVDM